MEKLNCFRGLFDLSPNRFIYQQPQEAPKSEAEKGESPTKTPEEKMLEQKKADVKDKYPDTIDTVNANDPKLRKIAEDILGNPEKLRQFSRSITELNKFSEEFGQFAVDDAGNTYLLWKADLIIEVMIDSIKTNPEFLKKLMNIYADKEPDEGGYIPDLISKKGYLKAESANKTPPMKPNDRGVVGSGGMD